MKNTAEEKANKDRILDALDWNILRELQLNGRISLAELGRKLGRTRAGIQQRVLRLEETGVIKGYWGQVNPIALGLPITAFIHLSVDAGRLQQFIELAKSRHEISECYIDRSQPTTCILRIHTASMARLQNSLDFLALYGAPSVTLVLSSPVEFRAIEQ